MELTCATYNILHGRYKDMILSNIRTLMQEGVDVFCLQETPQEFEKELLRFLRRESLMHWRTSFVHKGHGGHIALLWNANKLSLVRSDAVLLPSLGKPSGLQRIRGSKRVMQRVALVGNFLFEGRLVAIVCVHLSWEGGFLHRFRQVQLVRKAVDLHGADCVVVGGDFNTIGPRTIARIQRKRFEKIFGPGYKHVHPHVKWSFDTSFGDPLDSWDVAGRFRKVGIKWRTRLDYMFSYNLRVLEADMYDLPGSDHRPLVARFSPLLSPKRKVIQ